jgi:predicted DNA-binding transcriptional regulator YafY
VSGFEEIVWWILSMGPHCRVIKPKVLADRVRELAEQTTAVYDVSLAR